MPLCHLVFLVLENLCLCLSSLNTQNQVPRSTFFFCKVWFIWQFLFLAYQRCGFAVSFSKCKSVLLLKMEAELSFPPSSSCIFLLPPRGGWGCSWLHSQLCQEPSENQHVAQVSGGSFWVFWSSWLLGTVRTGDETREEYSPWSETRREGMGERPGLPLGTVYT